jgi:hypothetical protein
VPKSQYVCPHCGQTFLRYASQAPGAEVCCSNACRKERYKLRFCGRNNSNFGKFVDPVTSIVRSVIIRQKMQDPHIRWRCGSANRGRKFSSEVRQKMSARRRGLPGHPHTEESRAKIGLSSRNKWTPEYRDRHRRIMEESGRWVKIDDLSERDLYYAEANWICRMYDLVDTDKLRQYGVWHCKKNKTGLVRDHRYSRKSGLLNRVFPVIMRHPVNCRLISHAENVSIAQRHHGKYDDVITLDELFADVESYSGHWAEQERSLELIVAYRNGERWTRS